MAARGLTLLTTCAILLHTLDASSPYFTFQNETEADSEQYTKQIWCKTCACGMANRMERIVGGWPTRVNEYPWVVALSIRGQYYCGGTIINDLYILTAAHCVSDKNLKQLMVVVAEHNKASMAETMLEVRRVAKVIVHEEFNKGVKYNNDIALLKLDRRLHFRHDVAPVCLPYPDESFKDALGHVMGWGHTMEGGPAAMELMETYVAVITNSECHKWSGYGPSKVTNNMMCAGIMGGGRDTCQGDSGGSLVIEDYKGRMFQAGIVSWGIGCARPNRPGVYTRVNVYLNWIVKHTQDACYCL